MSILMALMILNGEASDLKHLFKEAAKTIEDAELKNYPYLCAETVQAISKFKEQAVKRRKK